MNNQQAETLPSKQAAHAAETGALAYTITRWSNRFENAQSRRIKDPSHTLTPHELDSRQLEYLMTQDGGPIALAVWHILTQLATRCPQRGLLVNEDGPLTDEAIAQACHLPEETVARALNLLTSDTLGWVDIVECPRQMLVTGSIRRSRNGSPKKPEVIPVKTIKEGPDFDIERLVTVVEDTPEGASSPQFKSVEVLPYEFEALLNPKEATVLEHKKASAQSGDSALEPMPEEELMRCILYWNKMHNLQKVKSLSIKTWFQLMQLARKTSPMSKLLIPAIESFSQTAHNGCPSLSFESFIFQGKEKAA